MQGHCFLPLSYPFTNIRHCFHCYLGDAVLVQHCANNSEYSTCYLHQYCVVVSQQCHRIASFLRLALSQISGTVFHCYLRNAVLDFHMDNKTTAKTVVLFWNIYFPIALFVILLSDSLRRYRDHIHRGAVSDNQNQRLRVLSHRVGSALARSN